MSDKNSKNPGSLFGNLNLKGLNEPTKKELAKEIDAAPKPVIDLGAKKEKPSVSVNPSDLTQTIKINSAGLVLKKKATKEQISFRLPSTYKETAQKLFEELKKANPEADLTISDVLSAIFVKGLEEVVK